MPFSTAPRLALLLTAATVALSAAMAGAQSPRKTIALRQAFRNDAYVLEAAFDRDESGRRVIPRAEPASLPAAASAPKPSPLSPAARNVLNYYANRRAATALRQLPRPRRIPSPAPAEAAPAPRALPFSSVETRPTVSPYLGLFREDFDEIAPNYFTYVRPQIERERINERQRREIDRLSRRPASGAPALPPTASGAARYGDTAQFYAR